MNLLSSKFKSIHKLPSHFKRVSDRIRAIGKVDLLEQSNISAASQDADKSRGMTARDRDGGARTRREPTRTVQNEGRERGIIFSRDFAGRFFIPLQQPVGIYIPATKDLCVVLVKYLSLLFDIYYSIQIEENLQN